MNLEEYNPDLRRHPSDESTQLQVPIVMLDVESVRTEHRISASVGLNPV
jgi:hypothetical protein